MSSRTLYTRHPRGGTIVALVAVAAMAFDGCGGGGGGGKSLDQVQSCLSKAGLAPVSNTGGAGDPGFQGGVAVGVAGNPGRAYVFVYKTSKQAKVAASDQQQIFGGTGGGSAKAKGNVVVTYSRAAPAAERSKVEGCAF